MSKEDFKNFVKTRPEFVTIIKNNGYTWQKLYEIYDIYGEDSNVWDNYIKKENKSSDSSMHELVNMIKTIDTNTIQRGIGGLQRALELFSGLINKEAVSETKPYEPRPIYKKFED